ARAALGMRLTYCARSWSTTTISAFCCSLAICRAHMKIGSGNTCRTHYGKRAAHFGWRSCDMFAACIRCIALLIVALVAAAPADDGPKWRGARREGAVTAGPTSWPEHLRMQWKVAVGEGHSSPIIAAGRIYVFTRQQGQETASSIDPEDGRFIWRQSYPAPY